MCSQAGYRAFDGPGLAFFTSMLGVACAYPMSRSPTDQKSIIMYRIVWIDSLVAYISYCTAGTVAVSDPPY